MTTSANSKKIHVFHLVKGLNRGGAEVLLAKGLEAADRERFELSYGYFLPSHTALVPDLLNQGATVDCFGTSSNARILGSIWKVARHLKARNVDIVHAHLPLTGVVGRIAGRLAGVPVIYSEHSKIEFYHPLTRWLNIKTWAWQEEVVAVSGNVAVSLKKHVGEAVPVNNIVNGVDTDAFNPEAFDGGEVREQLGIPRDSLVVGTVAVLRRAKRFDHWLQVAKKIAQQHPNVHFLLVGDGQERISLEQQARDLGLKGKVHFAGLTSVTGPFFAAMDIYLMTSEYEGLPVALLEAMAMAKPIVSTGVGGIPEVVLPGHHGFLRSFGDVEGLAADVSLLLVTTGSRNSLGQAARKRVLEGFSLTRMQAELEAIYMRVARVG